MPVTVSYEECNKRVAYISWSSQLDEGKILDTDGFSNGRGDFWDGQCFSFT